MICRNFSSEENTGDAGANERISTRISDKHGAKMWARTLQSKFHGPYCCQWFQHDGFVNFCGGSETNATYRRNPEFYAIIDLQEDMKL
jgi:hypothetical protein